MRNVYVAADNIVSPLGFTTDENLKSLKQGTTGIRLVNDQALMESPFYASVMDSGKLEDIAHAFGMAESHTRLEELLIVSARQALQQTRIVCDDPDTLIVISTIKGNIDLLTGGPRARFERERVYLWRLAEVIAQEFHASHRPIVISNACISGVLAITLAARYIQTGEYKNVVVCGGDIVSKFVVSGFQSLRSLSDTPCRPFDKDRNGLSLGEASGTMILTSDPSVVAGDERIVFVGGATSNDANHISGPSRTGEGLYRTIKRTIEEAKSHSVSSIDYVSAHGTATIYNDEAEALAINRAGLGAVPVNSLKGYWGHTLGAAGLIESIAAVRSVRGNFLLGTLGHQKVGTTSNINIVTRYTEQQVDNCLKTGSGFGGCNAAIAFARTA